MNLTGAELAALVRFMAARLDEAEATAKAVRQPHDWHQGDESDPWASWDRDMIYMWPPEYHTPVEADKHWRGLQADDDNLAAHIALNDPSTKLASITADRRLLAELAAAQDDLPVPGSVRDDPADSGVSHAHGMYDGLLLAVRCRAMAWNQHSDYQPGWAP